MRALLTTLLLIGVLVALSTPARAGDRIEQVLGQVDEFRARQPAAGVWQSASGVEWSTNSSVIPAFSGEVVDEGDEATLTELLRCLLVCPELDGGIDQIDGIRWNGERMTLGFDDAGALVYTIGATDVRGGVALEIERDTYRLRAAHWVAPSGQMVTISFAEYAPPGWQPVVLRVTSDPEVVELTFEHRAERAQNRDEGRE